MAAKNANNSGARDMRKESYVDFSALYNKYKRFWWLFVLCFVGCMGLAVFYLTVKKPVYALVSTILISDEDNSAAGSIGSAIMKSFSLGGSTASVDDEIIVINSLSITKDMVRELKLNCAYTLHKGFLNNDDLYKCSPITVSAPDAVFDTLTQMMKFVVKVSPEGNIKIKVKKGRFKTLAEVEADRFPVTVPTMLGIYVVDTTEFYRAGQELDIRAMVGGYQNVAEDYNELIDGVIISKKSNGIHLLYDDTNVPRGKDILNKIVELYNKRCQNEKDEMAVNTGRFIDERLNLIYGDLAESEADIEKFKIANDMVDIEADLTVIYGKKTLGEQTKLELVKEYEVMKMIKEFVNDPANDGSMIPFSVGISSEAGGPVEIYNSLMVERAKLAGSAKSSNVSLRQMDEQLATVRESVRNAVDRSLEGLRLQIEQADKVEAEAESALGSLPTKEREFRELYRQQYIKNELYIFLLQKREENALVLAAKSPKGKIVDNAYAFTKPIEPNKGLTLFVGLFFGLGLPVLILYLKALFTTRFTSQEELESIVNAPVLGEICHNRHRATLVVREGKTSSIVELFRLLRNNVQFMLPRESSNVLLVTSSVAGEGKSFVSLNLAASFALLGKRVVLVGMDIRSPKLAEYLKIKPAPGVTSFLAKKEVPLESIIQTSADVPGLDVIVGGPVPPNPSELLLSYRVEELVNTLRGQYDCVIIDSAPMAMVSDTFSLAPHCDLVLYVTRANYTKRSLIKYFNSVLARGQIKNAGVIINDSNPKLSQGYGYGYGSGDDDD